MHQNSSPIQHPEKRRRTIHTAVFTSGLLSGFVLFPGSLLLADTVILANRTRVTGTVENQTYTDVFLRTPEGLRKIPKNQIWRIEYEDVRKKAEEERRRQEELKKKEEEERQKKEAVEKRQQEERRLAEERAEQERQRQAREKEQAQMQQRRQELERQRRAEEDAVLRNRLRVGLDMGGATFYPGALTVRHNTEDFMVKMGNKGASTILRDDHPNPSGLATLSLQYAYNRFSLGFDGMITREKKNSPFFTTGMSNDPQGNPVETIGLGSIEYSRLRRSSVEARLGFDAIAAPRFRLGAFGGYRRQMTEMRGNLTGTGYVPVVGITYDFNEDTRQGSTLGGGLAGLSAQFNIGTGPRKMEFEIRGGRYQGTGNTSWSGFGYYRLLTDPPSGDLYYYDQSVHYDLKATGNFGSVELRIPAGRYLDVAVGAYGESLLFMPSYIDISSRLRPSTINDIIENRVTTHLFNDFLQNSFKARETFRSVYFGVRHNFDFR